MPLVAGSRKGARSYVAPELHRPDQPNPFGAIAPWNGLVAEVYGRNSRPELVGDSRSFVQLEDLPRALLTEGYAVRVNDEQGTSGAHISSDDRRKNRLVLQGIFARLIAGESHRLAVLEISRLARDESGQDPAYIKRIVRRHCDGQLIIYRHPHTRIVNLFENTDSRQYDLDAMLAGWRRQDDIEKSMEGYRRYIEDVVSGRREISMPHRLSFGYRRIPLKHPVSGDVLTNPAGRIRTELALDSDLAETMRAFRRAANVHNDTTRLARELNDARLPGPDRFRPVGQQWSRKAIRRLIRQDIYAGVWTPGRNFESDEITNYLIRQGFNPAKQRRSEPGLAWFTQAELDNWRAKFSDSKPISRQRKYDHPLLGILACDTCSRRTDTTAYLIRAGQQMVSASRGRQNIYKCPYAANGLCVYHVPEDAALAALEHQLDAIQHATKDVITRIAEWAAGGNVIRIQQAIRAKHDRRTFIDEAIIQPAIAAQIRPDPKYVVEHARLAQEIDELTRELDGLGAQTEALNRATDILRALGGRLDEAIPLLNPHGQAVVYSALIHVAYLQGIGKGRGKTNIVARLVTVAEARVYSQDEHNLAKSRRCT